MDISQPSSGCTTNPWCGQFGPGQVVEVVILIYLIVIGTAGNLLVIFSIIFEGGAFKQGGLLIINLAITDLVITGISLPTITACVIKTELAFPLVVCQVIGYLVTVSCVCSIASLTAIAIDRYWKIVHLASKGIRKTKNKRTYIMVVAAVWTWSVIITSPTLWGWSEVGYDERMMTCAWNDVKSLSYNITLTILAIFVPLCIIIVCYWKLYRYLHLRAKRMSRQSQVNATSNHCQPKFIRNEMNLLRTLSITVLVFVLFWTPYGLTIMIDPVYTSPVAKTIVGRLGLSNSAVNFMIYGITNPSYRKGYVNFVNKMQTVLHLKRNATPPTRRSFAGNTFR